MKKPKPYNIRPAKGQALLNFQGRRFADTMELFETDVIEEVRDRQVRDRWVKEQTLFDSSIEQNQKRETDLNSDFRNLLIGGDCLSVCAYLKSQNIKVDLVYIDPPFASGANYAKKIYLRNRGKSELEADDNTIGEEIIYGDIWQKEDYLNWLYERLLAIKDVMSETASIYLHLDWHIGHYVKILMDEVFGEENFVNEIIWKYNTGGIPEKIGFSKKHDVMFFYVINRDENVIWNKIEAKSYIRGDFFNPEQKRAKELGILKDQYGLYRMTLANDVWEIGKLFRNSPELLNYSTQKPEALLERIIKASSDEGMIVADFFSGSGTTAKVANDLNRKFIACDIGINAIQTTRDRLAQAGASFDVLKIQDGLRLFRNPTQTTAKIFSIIDGFRCRTELELSHFWDGGIAQAEGFYAPVKFSGIHEKLTKELLDIYLEEIYKLEGSTNSAGEVIIIYAHKDMDIDQRYLDKQLHQTAKTELRVRLISLDSLLAEKRDALFTPDNADIKITKQGSRYRVEIKNFYSSYLKNKIDDYNAKKSQGAAPKGIQKSTQQDTRANTQKGIQEDTQKDIQEGIQEGIFEQDAGKTVQISDNGLELIEAVQFDTTLGKTWKSNLDLEDKAGVKDKIKGSYILDTNRFKMKIRNIAGDEIIICSKEIGK